MSSASPSRPQATPPVSVRLHTMAQADQFSSPWSGRTRARIALWSIVSAALFRPTPKLPIFNRWRLFLLRLFGATVHGLPFVSAASKIKMPWNLEIHDRVCISPGTEIYNLGPCILRARSSITQYAYLCGGTHDLSQANLPLVVGTIDVGEDVFIGAKAMILPGVTIGAGAVVGAGSVVTKDVAPWTIVAGNPSRVIRPRVHPGAPEK